MFFGRKKSGIGIIITKFQTNLPGTETGCDFQIWNLKTFLGNQTGIRPGLPFFL
jgi:hypothetical protein